MNSFWKKSTKVIKLIKQKPLLFQFYYASEIQTILNYFKIDFRVDNILLLCKNKDHKLFELHFMENIPPETLVYFKNRTKELKCRNIELLIVTKHPFVEIKSLQQTLPDTLFFEITDFYTQIKSNHTL
jgi:hypothetical protein